MTTLQKYTRDLTFALRMHDVPGEAIGDAIAQVESHLAETGEDPVVAFGPASEYAATFAGEPVRHRWPRYLAHAVAGFVLGSILILGVFGQIRGDETLWGVPPFVVVAVGVGGLVGYFTVAIVVKKDQVKDPRKASAQRG